MEMMQEALSAILEKLDNLSAQVASAQASKYGDKPEMEEAVIPGQELPEEMEDESEEEGEEGEEDEEEEDDEEGKPVGKVSALEMIFKKANKKPE